MAQIELRDVTKRYPDGFDAVKDMNLEVGDGQFMILVGPSGCGKSTALRMIAGLEDTSEGELIIGGELVNDLPPRDRDIAMVFQNHALCPHMTVRENMGFALKLAKTDSEEIDRKVEEAAEVRTAGLDELAKDAGMEDLPHAGQEGAQQVVARPSSASSARPNQKVDLVLDTTRLQLFDRAGGRSLIAA